MTLHKQKERCQKHLLWEISTFKNIGRCVWSWGKVLQDNVKRLITEKWGGGCRLQHTGATSWEMCSFYRQMEELPANLLWLSVGPKRISKELLCGCFWNSSIIYPYLFGSFDHVKPKCVWKVAEAVNGQISIWSYFWESFRLITLFWNKLKSQNFVWVLFLVVSLLFLLLIFFTLHCLLVKKCILTIKHRHKAWSLSLRSLEFGEKDKHTGH